MLALFATGVATMVEAAAVAHELEGTLVMIGILPTIRERDLTLANIAFPAISTGIYRYPVAEAASIALLIAT